MPFPGKYFRGRAYKRLSVEERFLRGYLVSSSGCWIWKTKIKKTSYPLILIRSDDGKVSVRGAHIISWELHNGKIQDDLCVLHKCDVRVCVNPEHLFLGTRTDNMIDKEIKGRTSWGEQLPQSKLTIRDVRDIRALYLGGTITQAEIAKRYRVDRSAISRVITGDRWGKVVSNAVI